MCKMLFFMLAIMVTPALRAQSSDEREPFLTKSFSNGTIQQVNSETQGGNITVTAVAASQAHVEMYVWPNEGSDRQMPSKAEIQKQLDELYTIDISLTGVSSRPLPKARIILCIGQMP